MFGNTIFDLPYAPGAFEFPHETARRGRRFQRPSSSSSSPSSSSSSSASRHRRQANPVRGSFQDDLFSHPFELHQNKRKKETDYRRNGSKMTKNRDARAVDPESAARTIQRITRGALVRRSGLLGALKQLAGLRRDIDTVIERSSAWVDELSVACGMGSNGSDGRDGNEIVRCWPDALGFVRTHLEHFGDGEGDTDAEDDGSASISSSSTTTTTSGASASIGEIKRKHLAYELARAEEEIMRALLGVDAVPSRGSVIVRDARKSIVRNAETQLRAIEEIKTLPWWACAVVHTTPMHEDNEEDNEYEVVVAQEDMTDAGDSNHQSAATLGDFLSQGKAEVATAADDENDEDYVVVDVHPMSSTSNGLNDDDESVESEDRSDSDSDDDDDDDVDDDVDVDDVEDDDGMESSDNEYQREDQHCDGDRESDCDGSEDESMVSTDDHQPTRAVAPAAASNIHRVPIRFVDPNTRVGTRADRNGDDKEIHDFAALIRAIQKEQLMQRKEQVERQKMIQRERARARASWEQACAREMEMERVRRARRAQNAMRMSLGNGLWTLF